MAVTVVVYALSKRVSMTEPYLHLSRNASITLLQSVGLTAYTTFPSQFQRYNARSTSLLRCNSSVLLPVLLLQSMHLPLILRSQVSTNLSIVCENEPRKREGADWQHVWPLSYVWKRRAGPRANSLQSRQCEWRLQYARRSR